MNAFAAFGGGGAGIDANEYFFGPNLTFFGRGGVWKKNGRDCCE